MRRIAPLLLVLAALVPAAPVGAAVTRTSRPVRLLRTWEETVKAGGGDYARRVSVTVDYEKGRAYQTFSGPGMTTTRQVVSIGAPAPSQEEIDEAFAFVRTTPDLALIFKRFPDLVLEGGFILQEPEGRPCGPTTRCLRIFLLSSDRSGQIRQVVVDISRLRLAYSAYSPPVWRNE